MVPPGCARGRAVAVRYNIADYPLSRLIQGARMNVQASPAKPAGSRERSLEEVKAEFMRRAGRLNPFEEIRREDAETVMNALTDLDKDRWAREWSKIGHGYEEKADARAKAGASGKDLAELY